MCTLVMMVGVCDANWYEACSTMHLTAITKKTSGDTREKTLENSLVAFPSTIILELHYYCPSFYPFVPQQRQVQFVTLQRIFLHSFTTCDNRVSTIQIKLSSYTNERPNNSQQKGESDRNTGLYLEVCTIFFEMLASCTTL